MSQLNTEIAILVIFYIITIRNVGSYFIYQMRSTPKHLNINPIGMLFGWISLGMILYYYFNGGF